MPHLKKKEKVIYAEVTKVVSISLTFFGGDLRQINCSQIGQPSKTN